MYHKQPFNISYLTHIPYTYLYELQKQHSHTLTHIHISSIEIDHWRKVNEIFTIRCCLAPKLRISKNQCGGVWEGGANYILEKKKKKRVLEMKFP